MSSKKYISSIGRNLLERRESVATAESVTSGFLQFALSQGENASRFFQGGITAYNLGQKVKHLTVEPLQAEMCNCVSIETATEMALGAGRLFTSNWVLELPGTLRQFRH